MMIVLLVMMIAVQLKLRERILVEDSPLELMTGMSFVMFQATMCVQDCQSLTFLVMVVATAELIAMVVLLIEMT